MPTLDFEDLEKLREIGLYPTSIIEAVVPDLFFIGTQVVSKAVEEGTVSIHYLKDVDAPLYNIKEVEALCRKHIEPLRKNAWLN